MMSEELCYSCDENLSIKLHLFTVYDISIRINLLAVHVSVCTGDKYDWGKQSNP